MAAAEPTLRAAVAGDAAAIARLAGQLGYDVPAEAVAERLAVLRGHGGEVLVAVSPDGRVLGWMGLRVHVSLTSPREAEIASLVVDAPARNLGLGRRFIDAAETWARANHMNAVRVLSNTRRLDAHRFYDRSGYARIKTQQLFARRLEQG